jgi:DNA topoisomerase-2
MQHTEGSVKFFLKMTKPQLERLKLMGIVKKLKLESSLSTGNMILFDSKNKIKKYITPLDIIEDFYEGFTVSQFFLTIF